MVVSIRTLVKIASLAAISISTTQLNAAVVECEYYSKSEWPSTEERVCQDSTVPPLPLFSNDATTFSLWPVCESSSSDPDGDGWGWENFRSCRAEFPAAAPALPTPVDVAPAAQPLPAEPLSTEQRFATCNDSSSDPDGDGWGWENNASCIVDNNRPPVCESANSDPDGDGWGWENNDSCIVDTSDTQNEITEVPDTTSSQDGNDSSGSEEKTNTTVAQHPLCESASSDPDGDGYGWENNSSCIASPNTSSTDTTTADNTDSSTAANPDNTENVVAEADETDINTTESDADVTDLNKKAETSPNNAIIYQQDFETANVGIYTPEDLNAQWDTPLWHLGFRDGRANIITDMQNGKSLQITYPANKFGAGGASAFLSDLAFGVEIEGHYEELYLSYDMKFAEGFDFVRGGKLPGLCGYSYKQKPSDGCNTGGGYPTGYDGWSARGMWRVDGTLENYVYNASQESFYGDDEYWNVEAVPGHWHRVQHRVVLNTVGQKNGILEAWLDGNKVLSDNTVEYRKTEDIKINLFYFNTFYGGNDSSWATSTDQFMYFDNFRISTQPIENSDDFSSTLLQNDTSQNIETSSGGGPFFAPALLLLALLRRRSV